jgi:hypothetical protein
MKRVAGSLLAHRRHVMARAPIQVPGDHFGEEFALHHHFVNVENLALGTGTEWYERRQP